MAELSQHLEDSDVMASRPLIKPNTPLKISAASPLIVSR